MASRKKLLMVLRLAALVFIGWFGGYIHGRKTATVQRYETIEEMAERQPAMLQANLLVVAGSHHCGADYELGSLLQQFAAEKRKQITKQLNKGGEL